MNSSDREIVNLSKNNLLFFETNQQAFTELLTFVDFVDSKLNIGFVEINFAQDRDILIEALIKHQNCQDIQFEVLNFSDPDLRFLRDELVEKLKQIKIANDKKLILLITGLEKSIGVVEEYPDVLVNLNFVRDDLRIAVPYPVLLFLPDYALTRLAKYAPDFWAWGRKVFYFKTTHSTISETIENKIIIDRSINSFDLPEKQERIDLLLRLLSEFNFHKTQENKLNLRSLINIYNELGSTYETLGDYPKAINYHQQSLEVAKKIDDSRGIANSLLGLGNAYTSLRQYQQVIDYYLQSCQIFQEIDDLRGLATSLMGLSSVYNILGEYSRATNDYKKLLKIFQKLDDIWGIASSLTGLAVAYNCLKEYSQAINYYQQSLQIYRELDHHNGVAYSLFGLGVAYNSLGKYQPAIGYHQKSLRIFQKIGNRHGEAITWFNLGDTRKNLQLKSEAKTAFENAKKLYKAMKLDEEIEKCDRAIQDLEN